MKVMDVPERARLLAERVSGNADSADIVREYLARRKMMYEPEPETRPEVSVPERYYPQPNYGDYEYPVSTGMIQAMPIQREMSVSAPPTGVLADEVSVPVSDLFSDEAVARRALKQRYAESAFNDRARSKAGAQGAWQIMPITLKDYLGRGRGKAGDLNDPEYNRKVRDWVMGIIPRDLQEFWSEDDSDRAKLAKLYAAYNWGAGNLRGFLRKKQKAGVDISNPDNWVDDLNSETRRYVKYLAFDEDIPDTTYTNAAFERAAAERGYAEGGRLYRDGGDDDGIYLGELQPAIIKPNPVAVRLYTDPITKKTPITHSSLEMSEMGPVLGAGHSFFVSKGSHDPTYSLFTRNCSDATGEILEAISGRDFTSGITTPWGVRRKAMEVFGNYPGYFEGVGPDYGADSPHSTVQYFEIPWYDYRVARDIATKRRAESIDRSAEKAGLSDEKRKEIIQYIYNDSPLLPYRLNEEASGGRIHIKPENRGKFTALKKRTGHSASWFKAHGTPLQRKRATFALNAKKWRHGDGGPLDKYGDEAVRAALAKLKANTFEDGGDESTTNNVPTWQKLMGVPRTIKKLSRGRINKSNIGYMYDFPEKWAEKMFSNDEISEIRQNLYDNFLPGGYRLAEMKDAGNAAFGNVSSIPSTWEKAVAYDYPYDYTGSGFAYPALRDEAFATYLQIPESRQRERLSGDYLVPAIDSPQNATTYDNVYRFNRIMNPYFDDNLVGTWEAASSGKRKYYTTDPEGYTGSVFRKIRNGKSDGYWNVYGWGYGDLSDGKGADPSDTIGGTWTLSTGVDPNRGQFISYYDNYELNPSRGGKSAGSPKWFGTFPIGTADASGGIGKPFSLYDRVYLDDYYGVNSRPQNPNEYYGGYITPSSVSAKRRNK